MVKMMPFQFLTMYFDGESIEAKQSEGVWYLEGSDFELVGMKGKKYTFASRESAEFWVQHNLMLVMRKIPTPQKMIERLNKSKTKQGEAAYWLDEEIEAINHRNATIAGNEQTFPIWGQNFIEGNFE